MPPATAPAVIEPNILPIIKHIAITMSVIKPVKVYLSALTTALAKIIQTSSLYSNYLY